MSTTRLMILGLVRWLQPVHGYDVHRELMSWNVAQWANIQPGSIYHALRKLSEEGLLEPVATEQVGARPARTTYRVTTNGDAEFQQLLRRYWWEYKQPVDPFLAAFSFLPAMPRQEAVDALRQRADHVAEYVRGFRAQLATPERTRTEYKPAHVFWQFDLTLGRLEWEIAWCRGTADRIEAGEGVHYLPADQPALGERWRAMISGGPTGDRPARDEGLNE